LALHNWDAALAAQIRDLLHLEAWCQPRFQRCSAGLHSRQGRRLWQRYFQKSTALLKAVPITDNRAVEDARSLLVRVRAERGPQGTDTPPDRITNAMDGRARFGCKGKGSSKRTWHGYKATLITHAATDLILSVDVMPAQHVDGDALVPAVDALAPAFSHPRTLDGDEAYTSQGNRREMRKVGVCLIGPRTTKRRRGQVPGGGRVAKRVDRARRSRIEHVVAHVVRWRHNRRSPYIGLRKAWLQAAFAVCAANLVRLLTLWREHRLELPGLQPAA
jgi:hypothetical protein